MPANEHRFAEPPPTRLYLDTDIAVAYVIQNHPHHERVLGFLDRLARHGNTSLSISSLLWMEFVNVVTRETFRRELPVELHRRFRLARWHEAGVRQTYLRFMERSLTVLLDQFAWDEVSVTPAVRALALRAVTHYNLRPYDAVHLACATISGVTDIASFDKAFRRVDGLNLWNDLIHSTEH